MIENYGPSKVAVAVNAKGEVAVEPEKVVKSADGRSFTQERIIRASYDNPKYNGVPKGIPTGTNYLDAQRIFYRDTPPESQVAAVDEPPMREISKGNFVPCNMVPVSSFASNLDGAGKAALLDALASFLPEALDDLFKRLYVEITS